MWGGRTGGLGSGKSGPEYPVGHGRVFSADSGADRYVDPLATMDKPRADGILGRWRGRSGSGYYGGDC